MLAAIGFDFDHTLGVDNKLERTVAMDLLAERAAEASLPFDPVAVLAGVETALAAYRTGAATFAVAWGALLERVLHPGDDLQRYLDDFRDRCVLAVPSHVQALAGCHELLAVLTERKVPYALLTNGWSPLQEAKAQAIGFESPVLVSERIGFRKPQPGAFARLGTIFDAAPGDIWYVGDDPHNDVAGAIAAGLTGVWFDWEGLSYPAGCTAPNHVIHALVELVPLL